MKLTTAQQRLIEAMQKGAQLVCLNPMESLVLIISEFEHDGVPRSDIRPLMQLDLICEGPKPTDALFEMALTQAGLDWKPPVEV